MKFGAVFGGADKSKSLLQMQKISRFPYVSEFLVKKAKKCDQRSDRENLFL
jgi:hypothetical protein